MSARVLVTGAAGMLGSQLLLDAPSDKAAVGADLREAAEGAPPVELVGHDLSEEAGVTALFRAAGPLSGLIHAAAWTAVDAAEDHEDEARAANAVAPGLLAGACRAAGIPMVLVSTDFVFDGTKGAPYLEDDPAAPLGAYGRTKHEGEERARSAHPDGVAIARTQWLYGPRGRHFPATMRKLALEREELRVVHDQQGSPTSTLELAPALWDVLERGVPGVYHAACEGECSWYELAVAATDPLRRDGRKVAAIHPCTTEDYPVPAPRPARSTLACDRLTALRGRPLADWRDALSAFLALETC